ncbi:MULTISPECIES: MerR family transcriptional regulator [Anaeromyxobacter]|uniref:MerR family transcriptional regulator n=1 Tax=Anaeromyxobacter TaxID=161492 RepID=UPI001F566DEA|nr:MULTISPECIES: MerR family transcriptional regulator [unclassified Anaeromyxobacter]
MSSLRYPIRAVSRLTGISVDTLRAWERRYRVVEPQRDERGRLYSEEDVERLRLLAQAVGRGHAIGRIAALPLDELRALVASGGGEPELLRPGAPVDLASLRAAIERFEPAAFRRELSHLAAVLPAHALARDVALPLLRAVGEGWHEGRLSVTQEHLVSSELRSLLGALVRLQPIHENAPRLVLATPEGELHELGTLAAALVAAIAGLGAIYLGPSLPAAEVVAAAQYAAARVVVLGLTGGASPQALEAVAAVARELPASVEVWVGGAGADAAAQAGAPRVQAIADLDAFERALGRVRVGGSRGATD